MSARYALSGLPEARADLAHPVLGSRRVACVEAMNRHAGGSAEAILGGTDARQFHSCTSLLAAVSEAGSVVDQALAPHVDGQADPGTLHLLAGPPGSTQEFS